VFDYKLDAFNGNRSAETKVAITSVMPLRFVTI